MKLLITICISALIALIPITALKGAPLQIVVSGTVGGGPDVNARLLARHITKHLPNKQSAIVQNMNGGGGLVMMNWLYNIADRNNAIGNVTLNSNAILNGLTGDKNARFDLRKFNWLFSTSDGRTNSFVLWANRTRGLESIDQLLIPGNSFVIGNQDTGSRNIQSILLKEGMRIESKFVFGYKDIIMALVTNEIDARVGTLISAKANNPEWLRPGNVIHPILQIGGSTRHPELLNVPMISEFISADYRPLLDFFEQQMVLARLFVGPPGMDKKRIEQFNLAARKVEKDPDYLAEANKLNIDTNFVHYDETNQIIRQVLSTPNETLRKVFK